jgi:hypothetical protein
MTVSEVVQVVAPCVTAVGVIVAVFGLQASRRQRRRQFETLYVQRYWTLMDRLSLHALRNSALDTVGPDDEKVALAYLRLCEDQLEVRKGRWISDATWEIWSPGMRLQLTRWPFSKVWERVSKRETDDFVLLRQHAANDGFDPCELTTRHRKMAGLRGRNPL